MPDTDIAIIEVAAIGTAHSEQVLDLLVEAPLESLPSSDKVSDLLASVPVLLSPSHPRPPIRHNRSHSAQPLRSA